MTDARAAINNHAGLIWSIADLLRGDYKQSEYGRVVLPLVVLRRLDCVLEPTKAQVLKRLESTSVENVGVLHRDDVVRIHPHPPTSDWDIGAPKFVVIHRGRRHDTGREDRELEALDLGDVPNRALNDRAGGTPHLQRRRDQATDDTKILSIRAHHDVYRSSRDRVDDIKQFHKRPFLVLLFSEEQSPPALRTSS